MKAIKSAVAFVIYNKDKTKILTVQRPENDEDLPNVWGLPAGSLKDKESFEEAVLRSGKEKLGVKLKIIKLINEGKLERDKIVLHMKEYEVAIEEGKPNVPQKVSGITQYQKLNWSSPEKLKDAAQEGSLCSRLYLSSIGQSW